MRDFVIFSAILCVSIVSGDVSHLAGQQHHHHHHQQGYQYSAPPTNYVQAPVYPATASDAASSSYNGVVNSYVPPASGLVTQQYAPPPGALSLQRSQSYLTAPSAPASAPQYQTNVNSYSSGLSSTSYGNSQTQQYYSQQQQQDHHQQQPLAPIVTKHFYVHAAPEDPEENVGPRYVQVGRPRKNYKVIFIKAPTYGASSQIIPILPQNEEKTIVYVLSKKPTFNQNIQLPEPPVTEPSKPDVFFIKYKTAQEAAAAQEKIQAAYESGQLGAASDPQTQSILNSAVPSVANLNSGSSQVSSSFPVVQANSASQLGLSTSQYGSAYNSGSQAASDTQQHNHNTYLAPNSH